MPVAAFPVVVPKGLCTEDSGEEVAAQDRSSVILCWTNHCLPQRSSGGCEFTPEDVDPRNLPCNSQKCCEKVVLERLFGSCVLR